MEPVITVKVKGKKDLSTENDCSKCLVCQTVCDDKGSLCKLTKRGLQTFKNAVEIRKDEVCQRQCSDLQDADEF